MYAGRPTFRDYVRVIRYQPAFGLNLASALAFGGSLALKEGWLITVGIWAGVAAAGVLCFPIWRHFAPKNPKRWTSGRPENLHKNPSTRF